MELKYEVTLEKNKEDLFFKKIRKLKLLSFLGFKIVLKYNNQEFTKFDAGACKEIAQILKVVQIINTRKKKDKLNLIYDYTCDYLDNEFSQKNICNFKNNVCEYNRHVSKDKRVDSCCTRKLTKKTCQYFDEKTKRCTIKCISCKLFVCQYLRKKKKISYPIYQIPYLHYFLSLRQKLICSCSFYMPKDEIMAKLISCYKMP